MVVEVGPLLSAVAQKLQLSEADLVRQGAIAITGSDRRLMVLAMTMCRISVGSSGPAVPGSTGSSWPPDNARIAPRDLAVGRRTRELNYPFSSATITKSVSENCGGSSGTLEVD